MIGLTELLVILLGLLVAAGTVFWIWALLDCARNEPANDNDKIVWILIILLLPWLGALLYAIVRRPQRTAG